MSDDQRRRALGWKAPVRCRRRGWASRMSVEAAWAAVHLQCRPATILLTGNKTGRWVPDVGGRDNPRERSEATKDARPPTRSAYASAPRGLTRLGRRPRRDARLSVRTRAGPTHRFSAWRAARSPLLAKRRRTRSTVEWLTSNALTISQSGQAGPRGPSSALRRMRACVTWRSVRFRC